jgi:hypothetical protein
MSLTSRPTERGNSGECVGCAWNVIASHIPCIMVQKGKMETYGPKFLFLASIYRFVCGYILCIVCIVKSIGMALRDEWWNILVGCLVFSQEWFSKWEAKTKTGNIDHSNSICPQEHETSNRWLLTSSVVLLWNGGCGNTFSSLVRYVTPVLLSLWGTFWQYPR